MKPISEIASGMARPVEAAAGARQTPNVQRPEEEAQNRLRKPVMDEYVPEEKQEPAGRYWLGKDEDGQPKIYFDGQPTADAPQKPEGASEAPEQEQAAEPGQKSDGRKAERCVGNTDQVDREIERLKQKQAKLEQQIGAETDEAKRKNLEKQLDQVEAQLRQKDNDAYRKQHTKFS